MEQLNNLKSSRVSMFIPTSILKFVSYVIHLAFKQHASIMSKVTQKGKICCHAFWQKVVIIAIGKLLQLFGGNSTVLHSVYAQFRPSVKH